RAGGAAGRAAGGQQGLVDGLPAERRPEGAMALPARGMGLESVEELEATSPAQRPGAAARVRAAARALPVGDPGPLPLAAGNQSGRRHQQQDQGHQAGGLRLPGRRLLLPEDPGGLPRTWVKNLFSQNLANDLGFQQALRQQFLELRVLGFQRLQALGVRYVHAAELAPPEVVAGFREAVTPAELLDRHPRVRFLQELDDLLFAVPLLHVRPPGLGSDSN